MTASRAARRLSRDRSRCPGRILEDGSSWLGKSKNSLRLFAMTGSAYSEAIPGRDVQGPAAAQARVLDEGEYAPSGSVVPLTGSREAVANRRSESRRVAGTGGQGGQPGVGSRDETWEGARRGDCRSAASGSRQPAGQGRRQTYILLICLSP